MIQVKTPDELEAGDYWRGRARITAVRPQPDGSAHVLLDGSSEVLVLAAGTEVVVSPIPQAGATP